MKCQPQSKRRIEKEIGSSGSLHGTPLKWKSSEKSGGQRRRRTPFLCFSTNSCAKECLLMPRMYSNLYSSSVFVEQTEATLTPLQVLTSVPLPPWSWEWMLAHLATDSPLSHPLQYSHRSRPNRMGQAPLLRRTTVHSLPMRDSQKLDGLGHSPSNHPNGP